MTVKDVIELTSCAMRINLWKEYSVERTDYSLLNEDQLEELVQREAIMIQCTNAEEIEIYYK